MAGKPTGFTMISANVTQPALTFTPELLSPFCRPLTFGAGDVLRRKGRHYTDMFLLLAGAVEVDIESTGTAALTLSGAGTPIGEIAFLRGCPATATVTARTAGSGLVIDDERLALLERERPELAAALLHHLAATAEQRTSFNLTFVSSAAGSARTHGVEVFLCRDDAMLERAQRLRYEVYCHELDRQSPYADHETRTISDPLDAFGYTFVAVEDGETIGTLRANHTREGSLGVLEELYGMRQSPNYPRATSVCTKFIVRKSRRGGMAATRLISAVVRFGVERGVRDCYIDCDPHPPPLLRGARLQAGRPRILPPGERALPPDGARCRPARRRLATEGGARDYLRVFVRAQVVRLADGTRARRPGSRTVE